MQLTGHWPSRRRLVAGLAALATARLGSASAAEFCVGAPSHDAVAIGAPLGDLTRRVLWGVAIEAPATDDAALIDALAGEAPKFLAIANGLKFGFLYPDGLRHTPDWTECDSVVRVAERFRVPVRGDCLAWNDWLPKWVIALANERPRNWRARLETSFALHFADVFAHFVRLGANPDAPALRWCGCVNEPFNPWVVRHGTPGWRAGPWLDAFGTGVDGVPLYIHRAFELAAQHRATPATALFLNETNCDNDRYGPLVRPAMLRLVDSLQKAGRAIDAVGLECHLMPQWMNDRDNPDWTPFATFLRALADRGVKILLTELDVNDCSVSGEAARDALVTHYMSTFVAAALAVPAVEMVTNWDFSDKYSWLRSEAVYPHLAQWADCVADPPCPRPDIYDEAMRPKPARTGLAEALKAAR